MSSSSTYRPGDGSGSASARSEGISFHATMQHVRGGTISLWQLQANELSDEQLKKGFAVHPGVAQIEQNYSARASYLGWLAKFLGRLHAYLKFRGWSDVAPRMQRQRRALPRKLVVFQREPRRKRATHAKFSRTHTLAGDAGSTPQTGLRDGVAESCKAVVEYSRSSRMAGTPKTDVGWRSLLGMLSLWCACARFC